MKDFTFFKELNPALVDTHLIFTPAYRRGGGKHLYEIRFSLLTRNKISNSPPQWILRYYSRLELFIGVSVLVQMRHNSFTSYSLSFVLQTWSSDLV